MSRIVLVFFPDWETNALVIDCPPAAPAALVSARGRITHATREARAKGVQIGMRRALAEYLCEGLIVVPADPGRSARSFNVVLEALDEVSATVCMIRPGIAWIPASAARTLGGEETMCELIVDTIAEKTGSECYVGVGNGMLEAWVGALYGVIDPGEERVENLNLMHLKPLISTDEAEVESAVESLAALGVRTVSDLRNLGPGNVLARFGVAGQSLYRILWQGEPVSGAAPAPVDSIEQVLQFPSPVSDLGIGLGYLLEQSTNLVNRLVGKQVAANTVDIAAAIACPDGEAKRVRTWAIVDFPTPRDLVDRARWQVQGWVDELARSEPTSEECSQETFGVTTIVLTARDLVPISGLAKRLWSDQSKEGARSSATAFRLQALVGVDGVRQPRTRPGFDPVSRVVQPAWGTVQEVADWEKWKLPQKWVSHATFQNQWVGGLEGESPTTVLETPIQIELFDESGQRVKLRPDATMNATPRTLVVEEGIEDLQLGLSHGEEIFLTKVRGPWPILGRWWNSSEPDLAPRAWLVVQPVGLPKMLVKWFGGRWLLAALWY